MTINILMHKSWHVWNKDNLEKIERDEKEHADREAVKQAKQIEQESSERYSRISKRSIEQSTPKEGPDDEKNINFFEELEKQEKFDHVHKRKKREMTKEEKREIPKNFFTEDSMKEFNSKIAEKQWYEAEPNEPVKPKERSPYYNPHKFRNFDDPLMMMNFWAPTARTPSGGHQSTTHTNDKRAEDLKRESKEDKRLIAKKESKEGHRDKEKSHRSKSKHKKHKKEKRHKSGKDKRKHRKKERSKKHRRSSSSSDSDSSSSDSSDSSSSSFEYQEKEKHSDLLSLIEEKKRGVGLS